jgi:hypothetical protein
MINIIASFLFGVFLGVVMGVAIKSTPLNKARQERLDRLEYMTEESAKVCGVALEACTKSKESFDKVTAINAVKIEPLDTHVKMPFGNRTIKK